MLNDFVIPVSYGSTEVIDTGKWGFQKPETVFMAAPCQEACPAGNPIPQFLYLAGEGRHEDALRTLLIENPFPGVCGRVCFHPCEGECNRRQYDEAVSINALERRVFDATSRLTPERQIVESQDPGRIAVVGSGPAGLSAAYFLALLGHRVTLFEAARELGGVMRWGIPEYRLPKAVLRKEIQRVLSLGIEVRKGVRVGRDVFFDELNGFDAVFLSPGAGVGLSLGIQGEGIKRVWKGGELLERINSGERPKIGKEVLVVGGGNTAMDVARCVLRLGSKAKIVYRRTKTEMPAIADEVIEAGEEGVRFEFLAQPVKIDLLKNKKIRVTLQRMKIRGLDRSNRRKAVPVRGSYVTMEADGLVTAAGEGVDLSWIPDALIEKGLIGADANLMTKGKKIFAGGDAIDRPRSVVTAISAGKRGAISIDLQLRGLSGEDVFPKIGIGAKGALSMEAYLKGRETGEWPEPKGVVLYDRINTLYFKPSRRIAVRKRPEGVQKDFKEINLSYSREEANASALRCFSCGTCNYCLNCYYFCPEGVVSLDPVRQTKTVDLDHCKGCGTCAKSCPRSAVVMKEVT
jgi:NADPH-dependent glutamate synthase beta subunit-like oxidoreductase